ncbi:Trm112 family protein [Roseovarius sp. M141]|uniref:Trm112 family protein n=1 Tax=Roseovarius sp. M141 TaxID=2583806 RepID=UPI0020CD3F58|nr:Trm112 family protein [Roseovarius sp. M141]MCQ0091907.1 Trm112 family protein [Roseovarius sp. M141]
MSAKEGGPEFDRRMLEALICPQTHQRLEYDAAARELISRSAGLAFPIRAGIPILLISEGRELD